MRVSSGHCYMNDITRSDDCLQGAAHYCHTSTTSTTTTATNIYCCCKYRGCRGSVEEEEDTLSLELAAYVVDV